MSNKSRHRATDISKILSKYERLLIFSAIAKVTCQIQIPAGMQNFQCTTKMPYCLLFLLYCALFCVFCTIFYCFFWLARHPRPINHHHIYFYLTNTGIIIMLSCSTLWHNLPSFIVFIVVVVDDDFSFDY